MKHFLIVFAVSFIVTACSERKVPSIDEEIAALPDSWEGLRTNSIQTVCWTLLDRVSRIDDAKERIRLLRQLYVRFTHPPEWYDSRQESIYAFEYRRAFRLSCIDRIIRRHRLPEGVQLIPEMIVEGWHMESESLTDMEQFIRHAESVWNIDRSHPNNSEQAKLKEWFAYSTRREYEMFFSHSFATCVYASYEDLPESMRPAFVEQIRRDFFSRKGMMYVKKEDLPKALQDVSPSTTNSMTKQENDDRPERGAATRRPEDGRHCR